MRIVLGVEYNGSAYYGFQRQKKEESVQKKLEEALSIVANENIMTYCASRTDSGVHATGQVVHFDTCSNRSKNEWILGTNANLPVDIAVQWAVQVSDNFHARFSALSRSYRYIIYNSLSRSTLFINGMLHFRYPLDVAAMLRASKYLIGIHDFSSFFSKQDQRRNKFRHVYNLHIIKQGKYILIDIRANSFAYHMIRNIIGCLLKIGSGHQPETWLSEILKCRNIIKSNHLAPSRGLYLTSVEYPEYFSIPNIPAKPSIF